VKRLDAPSPVSMAANRLSDEQERDFGAALSRGEGSRRWLRPSVASANNGDGPLVSRRALGEEVLRDSSSGKRMARAKLSPLATTAPVAVCRRLT